MTTTLPSNQVFLNAQASLLQRLYNQAPTDRITNGLVQVGVVVIFSNGNSPLSANIYTNAQGALLDVNGNPLTQLSFGGGTDTFVGGKAFVALSGELDWATANAFQSSPGVYDEALFSFENALFYQVQLDSFEFTFNNGPFDGANLTSVTWFSIPMRMWVPGNTSSGNQSGFIASPNQENWVAALQGLVPNGENVFKDADGNLLIAASPTTTTFSNPSYAWQFLPDVNGTTFTVAKNLNFYPNQIVQFSASTGGTLPQPLQANTNYYVLTYDNSSGNLTVSNTLGGNPITFTPGPDFAFVSLPVIDPPPNQSQEQYQIILPQNLDFLPGQKVSFSQTGNGFLPAPLQAGIEYFVQDYNPSTGALQVSTTSGGDPIQFTTTGSNPQNLAVTNQSIAGNSAPDLNVTITTPDYPTSAYANFDTYVNDFIGWLPTLTQGTQPADSNYSISGYFNGAPSADAGESIWHSAGFYNYQIYYDATKKNVVLIPGSQITNAGVSQVQGVIAISVSELENSIIATNGTYTVYNSLTDYFNNTPYNYVTNFPSDTTPASVTTITNINTGSNNQWGPVFANLATGFVAGYWRENNASQNTALFNNSNFWSYFQANGTPKAFSDTTPGFFDPYSKLFAQNSNSYGGNYTDNLTKSLILGGPLLTVGTPSNTDNSIYVSLLDINNLPNTSQTPPSSDVPTSFADFTWNGYQSPVQLAPSQLTPTTFSAPPAVNNFSSFGVTINFSGQMVLPNPGQIKFISLKSSDGNFTGQAESFSGWGNYQYQPGNQTPFYNQAGQLDGVVNLVNFPLPNAAGTTLYTVQFLDQDKKLLYETQFYLTTDGNYYGVTVGSGSGQQVQDRYFPLAQSQTIPANNLAASVPYTQSLLTSSDFGGLPTSPSNPNMDYGNYLNALTLTPVAGSSPQLPPNLWDYNASFLGNNPNLPVPWAPLVWTQNGTDFTLPSDYTTTTPGPANYTINTVLTTGDLTFSWLGGPNTLAGEPQYTLPTPFTQTVGTTAAVLSNYTNKTFAAANGTLTFANAPNGLTPLSFQADIDGQWALSTNPVTPLTNGTYTISMAQALTDAEGNSITVGYAGESTSSYSTTFTVNAPSLSFQPQTQGLTVKLPTGVTSGGQWMDVRIDSWEKSENSTFILYATNAAGQLISRDQTQVGGAVTLADATLAKIGVVVTDNGTLLQEGQASVYLRPDQFLRIAVLAGDGSVIEDLPVSNTVLDGGKEDKALLTTESFTFTGELVDTLTPTTWLANAQLQQDEPIYFFQANSTIQIEASGSCALTNTLKWAPVTFDPLTGQKMVGGVLAADTDAFRDSLKENALDFSIVGTGAQFDVTKALKIVIEGYYAPFLETSAGNTFFIGTAANPNNQTHFRLFGNGVFGIEDLPGTITSDFDFNDMVVRMTPV